MTQRVPISIEDEMRQSYMDYAMSVIIGRALPDARDGLKPVHHRVLYAMNELGVDWNRPYKKSARIVGDVIGKYHPHGDAAVYDTIVRLAQDFSMRYPLVDGQGNFGSVDGDAPAAMRYTEIRLARIASELLADIDRETVDFVPNYDDSEREPSVLPAKIPNLLLNGASGIAVGMATNVPPHNLGELVDGCIALLANPALDSVQLMEFIPGPDFPTGAFICGRAPIREAYTTGRGILQMRASAEIEEDARTGRETIVVDAIPYQVNKARLIERIAELVNDKKIDGISDLRDESDRTGMRIVIELKKDAVAQVVLNQLYKLTPMQESFGVNLLAIVEGRPKLLTLRDALVVFLDHRREVVTRRTIFDLRKAEERLHVLDGLKIALDNLDAVIALIRAAASPADARTGLMSSFALSEIQAQAILDMRLQRLTNLERDKILEEHREVSELIAKLKHILANPSEIDAIIRDELRQMKEQYGDARRTAIVEPTDDLSIEDLIAREDMVVTVSHAGYTKRIPASEYRAQRRGGRGKLGATARDEDFIENLFVASTHDSILFFTSKGRVHWRKVHEIPTGSRAARGKAIVNLLHLGPEEKIKAFLPVAAWEPGHYVLFATRKGVVKKTELMAYATRRAAGIIAIGLDEGDELIGVRLLEKDQEVLLSTRNGQAIRFREGDVRAMGRGAGGVRGINLDEGDEVVSVDILSPGATILSVSEKGQGKRSDLEEYRLQTRGGKGIITMKVTERTGAVVGVVQVGEDDEVMLVTDRGRLIRLRVSDIRVIGRNTQGVKLLDVDEGERVVSLARVVESDDRNGAARPASAAADATNGASDGAEAGDGVAENGSDAGDDEDGNGGDGGSGGSGD
ncbi:MAG TPA: DNA gyrase subunit A [Candidatus Binatia bacterium]|nr:DNA gyrase subunit A [Candidatus Binatia bacterium]